MDKKHSGGLKLAIFVLWIGLAPAPFFKIVDPSINNLLDDFNKRKVAHIETEQPMQTAANDILGVVVDKQ